MIRCFTGMPGSGKSFAMTNVARQGMKQGREVYSNFYIKGAYKITFDDLVTYSFPPGAIVLIDEGGRWFNSRSWEKLPSDIFDLFSMHRHMNLDLYIAVQNFARIDKSLREVIELVYWARNYAWLPFFIHDGYYDLEKLGNMKESDVRKIVWKSKKVKELYDTHSMKSAFDDKFLMPKNEWETKKIDKSKKSYYNVLQDMSKGVIKNVKAKLQKR